MVCCTCMSSSNISTAHRYITSIQTYSFSRTCTLSDIFLTFFSDSFLTAEILPNNRRKTNSSSVVKFFFSDFFSTLSSNRTHLFLKKKKKRKHYALCYRVTLVKRFIRPREEILKVLIKRWSYFIIITVEPR